MKDGYIVELLKTNPAELDEKINEAGGIFAFFMQATQKDVHGNVELKKATKKFQKQANEFGAYVNKLLAEGVKPEATVDDGAED